MNLNQLIADIELYPHGVITKTYVLKHLRAIQRDNAEKDDGVLTNQSNRFAELLQNAKKDVI